MFPLLSLLVFSSVHWFLSAQLKRQGLKWLGLASGLSFGLTWLFFHEESFVYALTTHGFLLMLYLHFYVGVDRSVSVRVLHELLDQPGHELSAQALAERYPQSEMFAARVDLMVKHEWIREERGQFFVTAKSRILVLPTEILRRLYDLRETW